MNSTASTVRTCAVAGRATIDTFLLRPAWASGLTRGHGVVDRGPGLDSVNLLRPVPEGQMSARRWYGRDRPGGRTVLHLFVHELIHTSVEPPAQRDAFVTSGDRAPPHADA